MQPILQLKKIDKRFTMVHALKAVTLDVYPGETLTLVGENGAGKSTLMKILTGAYIRDSGEIWISGKKAEYRSPLEAKRFGVAQVYQQAELIPELTVAENLFLGEQGFAQKGLVHWPDLFCKAEGLLRGCGVDIDPYEKVKNLNVAYRQLVAIVKVVNRDPAILIFDEPTAVLSNKEVGVLFSLLDQLKARGKTILYISHRLEEIFQISDRIAIMRDGELVTVLPNQNVSKTDLITHMLGRQMGAMFPKRSNCTCDETVLEVKNVSTSKVCGITFRLRRGEILGVTGLVGSGRTEMARAIYGLDPLLEGQIRINGLQKNIRSPRDAMKNGIFLAPEDRKGEALVLVRPIRENVTLSNLKRISKWGWCQKSDERTLVERLREQMRIKTQSIETLVRNLSGGNQQKVVIAKAIAAQPDILIVDEPTQGIDVGAKSEIYALLEQMRQAGMSILLISSEIEEVQGMCNRILVMRGGAIVGEVEQDLENSEHILSLMYRSDPS